MNKNNLGFFIAQLVCGLTCIGLGIYYVFCGEPAEVAVFMVVGAVCVVMAVRTLFALLKEKKNKNKTEEEKEKE